MATKNTATKCKHPGVSIDHKCTHCGVSMVQVGRRGAWRPVRASDVSKDATLAAIALNVFGCETLETRNSDRLDFREVAVWNIKAALEQAFAAGKASGR